MAKDKALAKKIKLWQQELTVACKEKNAKQIAEIYDKWYNNMDKVPLQRSLFAQSVSGFFDCMEAGDEQTYISFLFCEFCG